MDYIETLAGIEARIKGGQFSDAVVEASKTVEALMKELYEEVLQHCPKDQEQTLRFEHDRLTHSSKSLSLGQWARLLNKSDFRHLLEKRYPKLCYIKADELYALAELRNKCAHHVEYKPTRIEADRARISLQLFLQDVGRQVERSESESSGLSWNSILDQKIKQSSSAAKD